MKHDIEFLPQYKDVLTVDDCADALRICTKQVRTLIENKEIKSFRVGKSIRIPKVYLEEFISKQLEEPEQLETEEIDD